MSFTYDNQGTSSFLVYEMEPGETLDTVGLGMIRNNNLRNILGISYTQMDEKRYLRYNISSKPTLENFFSGVVVKKRLLDVFIGICDAVEDGGAYMLETGLFVLDPRHIYVNVATGEPSLVYLPVLEKVQELNLGTFFKQIMFNAQFDTNENNDYFAKIVNFLNTSTNFSLADFRQLMADLKNETGAQDRAPMGIPIQRKPQSAPVSSSAAGRPAGRPVPPPPRSGGAATPGFRTVVVPGQSSAQPAPQPKPAPQPMTMPKPAPAAGKKEKGKKSGMLGGLLSKKKKDAPEAPPAAVGFDIPGSKGPGFDIPGSMGPGFDIPGSKSPAVDFAVPGKTPHTPPVVPRPAPTPAPAPAPAPAPVVQPPKRTQPPLPVDDGGGYSSIPQHVLDKMNGGNQAQGTVVLAGSSPTTVLTNVVGAPEVEKPKQGYLTRNKNGEVLRLDKNMVRIGRDATFVDYCITDNPAISHSHADIVRQGEDYFLRDNNSANHTYINGTMVIGDQPQPLNSGDTITLANETFSFEMK